MIIAELRGKLSDRIAEKEDILTSNVFSFFKYADREVFLRRFLDELLRVPVSKEDAENAEFQFWMRYPDYTEPDLVMLVGNFYILIEAKLHSTFEGETKERKAQLLRELQGGSYEARNLGKEFYLVAVTADYLYKPEQFEIIRDILPVANFRWINWQQICGWLLQILEEEKMQPTTRLFCQDLCDLLDRKKLHSFRSFHAVLSGIQGLLLPSKIFFEVETAALRGDFIGFQGALSFSGKLQKPPSRIFFGSRSFFSPPSRRLLKYNDELIFFSKEAS